MTSNVDLSLEEIIKTTKVSTRGTRRGRGRGGLRGSTRGATRGGATRGAVTRGAVRGRGSTRGRGLTRARGMRTSSFRSERGGSAINGRWSHDLYYGGAGAAVRSLSTGPTKLNIKNLDYGVSDSDIKELFSEFGNMKNASVHYDRAGRSLGTAHVIFDRRSDALKAIKQYNGVHLDGRPMSIEIEGATSSRGGAAMNGTRGLGGGRNVKRLQGATRPIGVGGGVGRGRSPRRGLRGGRARGGRASRGAARGGKKKVPTAEELDAELDAYTFQANNK